MPLTLEMLQKLWPHGNSIIPGLLEGLANTAPIVFPKYGLNSDLTIAHAMAQFSEECNAGLEMKENMNYSAARLLEVFPSHFTHSQAILYQHNPRQIADHAYGGRMGNAPPPSDDGWNFRGQGFSQLTGKSNYVSLAKTTKLDLINHPEFLVDPEHALECGVGDFIQCGCLPYALKDSLVGVSSTLNVGHYTSNINAINGYSMRKQWLALWKHVLGV
jgi:putative chitinase